MTGGQWGSANVAQLPWTELQTLSREGQLDGPPAPQGAEDRFLRHNGEGGRCYSLDHWTLVPVQDTAARMCLLGSWWVGRRDGEKQKGGGRMDAQWDVGKRHLAAQVPVSHVLQSCWSGSAQGSGVQAHSTLRVIRVRSLQHRYGHALPRPGAGSGPASCPERRAGLMSGVGQSLPAAAGSSGS